MDRTELVAVTAAILFAAFLLGWVGHWLAGRLGRADESDMSELDRVAKALHDAEERALEEAEKARRREAELAGRLSEAEAELGAAMEGLREATREADELRAYIERANQS